MSQNANDSRDVRQSDPSFPPPSPAPDATPGPAGDTAPDRNILEPIPTVNKPGSEGGTLG